MDLMQKTVEGIKSREPGASFSDRETVTAIRWAFSSLVLQLATVIQFATLGLID
jgi:hypothetical protein